MSNPDFNTQPAPVKRKRNKLVIAAVVVATAIGGMVAARAFNGPAHFGPGGFMMHHGGGFGMMDPAAIEDRADKAIRHLAIEIDATNEQQDKLRGIAKGLVKDMVPLRDAHRQTAQRARALLTGANVDAAEIEKFRVEQVAKMDAVTKRVTQALTEAANVLTPEQRRKIDQRLPQPGSGPFWRRG